MSKTKENIFSSSECLSIDAIIKYLDEECTLKERHKVEKHMLDCALCNEAVEGYALMKDKEKAEGIISELNRGFKEDEFHIDVRKIAAGIAAAFILGGGLIYLNISLDTVKNPIAIQEKKSDNKLLKPETPSDNLNTDKQGPIAIENKRSGTEDENNLFYEPNKEGAKGITHLEVSDSYLWENNTAAPAAAQGDRGAPTRAAIPDTMILKDHFILGNSTGAPEAEEQLMKEKAEVLSDQKNMAKMKKAKSADREAPVANAAKADDLEFALISYNVDHGIQKYQDKKYKEAIRIFEQIVKLDSLNSKALYYNGLSYYELKNWDKAIENFDLIKKGKEFYDDALWKKALVLIKKGDKNSAKAILKVIAGREGPYKERALEELKK